MSFYDSLSASLTGPSRFSGRVRAIGMMLLGGLSLVVLQAGSAQAFFDSNDQANPAGASAAVLSPPVSASASVLGSGALQISWEPAVSQLVGAQYQVVRTSGAGSPLTVCTVSAAVISCTDSGLLPGTAYGYNVGAVLHNWRSPVVPAAGTTAIPTLSISLSSASTVAGTALNVDSVTAQVGGLTDPTYGGLRTMIWSGLASSPASSLPIYPSSSLTFVNGVAASGAGFAPAGVTPYAAGAATLVATDAVSSAITGSVNLTVTNAPAAALAFSTQPSNGLAGEALGTQPAVVVQDAYGNLVVGSIDLVQLTLSSGTFASGLSTAATNAVGGLASFSGLQVNLTGSYTLLATDLDPPTLLNATSSSFTISPGTGSSLQFVQQPAALTVAGVSMSPAPSVRILDQFGNLTTRTSTVTLSVSTNPCGGVPGLSGNGVNAVNGLATFTSLQLTKSCAGYVLQATNGVATLDSTGFAIDPAAASKLAFVTTTFSGPNSATANLGPITVQQRDQFDNPVNASGAGTTVSLSQTAVTGTGVFATTLLGTTLSPAQVTIPAASSTVSFFFASNEPGAKTITASGPLGFVSASLNGDIIAAGLELTPLAYVVGPGSTGAPTVTCTAMGPNRTCNVTGLGNGGLVVFSVRFATASGPFSYSASASTITGTGPILGTTTIPGGASTSSTGLAASHNVDPATTTVHFAQGGYTITVIVSN